MMDGSTAPLYSSFISAGSIVRHVKITACYAPDLVVRTGLNVLEVLIRTHRCSRVSSGRPEVCALIARAAKRSYILGHAGEPALMLPALSLLRRCFMVCREALVDATVVVMICIGSR
jgi:hypothetical protein